ncbi:MAG: lipopolysaccharide biosynthesis protein [Bacteroidaceae bacterium]|nr:lipopolysaccharide biosynthesis protein [Bacteroidaceae bacterium]
MAKNTKIAYYLRSYSLLLCPKFILRHILRRRLKEIAASPEKEYIMSRVDYYNRLADGATLPADAPTLGEHTLKNKKCGSVYFFDTYEYTRYFDAPLRWLLKGGDVTTIPPHPTIVKSRPIAGDNANSVLMKLNKVRHFFFVNDPIPFEEKENKILFRGDANGKPCRIRFFEKWFGHPMCDLRDTAGHSVNPAEWKGPGMSVEEHFKCRYIMALEGVDVASNLKWVMSSNCIAVMPRPTYETWFMEGTLIPNYHYIEIKPDYSDLLERIEYYNNHIDEAKEIIKHANEYVEQFRNKHRENLISLAVLAKYFEKTGQCAKTDCKA